MNGTIGGWPLLLWIGKVILLLNLSTICIARPAGLEKYSLVRVIDGDTIVVTRPGSDPEVHVRMLGIDCLESRRIDRLEDQAAQLGISVDEALAIGKDTTAVVEQKLSGRPIFLELEEGSNDKYGRLIAYVWAEGDEQSLNLQLVHSGLALVYDGGGKFKNEDAFHAAESSAQVNQVGIWESRLQAQTPTPVAQTQTPISQTPTPTPISQTQTPIAKKPYSRRRPRQASFPYHLVVLSAGLAIIVFGIRMK